MSSSPSGSQPASVPEPFRRPSTLPQLRWARVKNTGAHILRRGAWYPVFRQRTDGTLLLEVRREIIPMNEAFVELTDEKPSRWSVVRRHPGEYGAIRASQANLAPTYIVCPGCHHRANFKAQAMEVQCERCQGVFEVDWTHSC